jgi:hypothetical protein
MILVRAAVLALLANRLQRHREARDEATCDEADRRQLRPTAHVRADRGLRTLTVYAELPAAVSPPPPLHTRGTPCLLLAPAELATS